MKPMAYLAYIGLFLSLFTGSAHALVGEKIKPQTKEIKGEVWPEVKAQVLIKASALESVAIFAAYDYQQEYVPDLIDSEVISEEITATTNDTHVRYTLKMPWPLGNSKYVHAHELSQPEKDTYKVKWSMIKSDSAEKVEGDAVFKPHPENANYTLMTYTSLVSPKSFFAGIFRDLMVEDVTKSLKAIRSTTEALVQKNPGLVKTYTDKIGDVLSGKKAYLKTK